MLFRLVFCLILTTAPLMTAYAMDDDLAIDMGLDNMQSVEKISTQTPPPPPPSPSAKNDITFADISPAPQKKNVKTMKAKVAAKPVEPQLDLMTKLRRKMYIRTEDVEKWAVQTPDINTCLENGRTMLIYLASSSTNAEAVSFLLANGADLQTHCVPQYEALFVAAENNPTVAVMETLITNDANLIAKDDNGSTALILAGASNSNPEIIKLLLEYGLKTEVKNNFGFDALMLASYNNSSFPVLQVLLKNGADVNSTDLKGRTPLMAAAIKGRDTIMQYLIRSGADFNAVDNDGVSVLDYYNKRFYLNTLPFSTDEFATVSERLNDEFDFISFNHRKYNDMLRQGIYTENAMEVVSEALANNPDIDVTDDNGCTTFFNALINNNERAILEKLLTAGANINAACQKGKSALMVTAALAGNEELLPRQMDNALFLLRNGANINQADEGGNTALMYAAAAGASPRFIEVFADNNADINAMNKNGETALLIAVKNKAPTNTVAMLLDKGANPDKADLNKESPLWYLLKNNGNADILHLLTEAGANTTRPDINGNLPLWYALNNFLNANMILPLIAVEKNLNKPDKNGDTPLLFAIKNNFPPIVIKQFLTHGADPKIAGKDGKNAYDVLKQSRFFDETLQRRTREHVLDDWN